jgi:hypothetical protein
MKHINFNILGIEWVWNKTLKGYTHQTSRNNTDKTTKRQLIENVSISKAKRHINKNVCEVK